MKHQTILQCDVDDLHQVIREEMEALARRSVLAKFESRLVSVDTVADIHDVHRDTVLRYAKAGLIPQIKDGKLYKFQLSDILALNFHELKKTKSILQ